MHKVLFLFFSSLLLFSRPFANKVYADDPTPTPSPTWVPLYEWEESIGDENYSCPEGMPEGYLTVTPSLMWSAQCGQCLSTALPTQTLDPSQPTPTETPTPIVDVAFTHESFYSHNIGPEPYFWFDEESITYDGVTTPRHVLVHAVGDGTNAYNDVYYWGDLEVDRTTEGEVYFWIDAGYSSFPIEVRYKAGSSEAEWSEWSVNNNQHYEFMTTDDGLEGWKIHIQWRAYGNSGGGSINKNIHIYFDVYDFGDPNDLNPTPTPEPDPESYCDEIVGYENIEDYWDIVPNPAVGPAECTGWQEYELTILGAELTLPEVELCLVPITFGQLNIIGVIIDLDTIILAMTAALMIRWFFRS